MRSRAISVSALLSAAMLSFACEREADTVTAERLRWPSDPVVEVRMGKGVSADGMVPAGLRTDDFRPGDTIFIAARFRGMEGQPVTVSWLGPGGFPAGSETGTVNAGGTIHFRKADTSSWIPGDYRVTLSAGSRTLVSEQFHILGSEAAVMPQQ